MLNPTTEQAETVLAEAALLNPGSWVRHSQVVAYAARMIASRHPGLDRDRAYVLGLLHDIGRREGSSEMHHILDGYHFLQNMDWPEPARICLTHSYPIKEAASGAGEWDGSEAELQFVQNFLDRIEYSDYDRLIQLCDAISLPDGVCLMEKRLLDVVMRHGFNRFSLLRIQAFQQIQADFEHGLGTSIYEYFPEVVVNTFGIVP